MSLKFLLQSRSRFLVFLGISHDFQYFVGASASSSKICIRLRIHMSICIGMWRRPSLLLCLLEAKRSKVERWATKAQARLRIFSLRGGQRAREKIEKQVQNPRIIQFELPASFQYSRTSVLPSVFFEIEFSDESEIPATISF